jgi:apolipoprotein D and lipocalin family protein
LKVQIVREKIKKESEMNKRNSSKRVYLCSLALLLIIPKVALTNSETSVNIQGIVPLNPITQLELKDFLGTWHQIAKIPNRFEARCVSNTQAHYSVSARPGLLDVRNSCKDRNGTTQVAQGWARLEDAPSVFSVTFFQFHGRPIFVLRRNFWIIGMSTAKNFMVVGYPNRKLGWILARTTTLAHSELIEAQRVLTEQGYNPCLLMISRHDDAYPTNISLCEVTTLPF